MEFTVLGLRGEVEIYGLGFQGLALSGAFILLMD